MPSKDLVIYLKGVKVKYLTYLIEFIYHGNVDVHPNDLQKFLELGQELKVKGLAKKNKKEHTAAVKCENVEFQLESHSTTQEPIDPLQDNTSYYEDYYNNQDSIQLEPELG